MGGEQLEARTLCVLIAPSLRGKLVWPQAARLVGWFPLI